MKACRIFQFPCNGIQFLEDLERATDDDPGLFPSRSGHDLVSLTGGIGDTYAMGRAVLIPCFARQDHKGRPVDGSDLFGPTWLVAGAGVSNAGQPRLPMRLMVGLLYLKHAFGESD